MNVLPTTFAGREAVLRVLRKLHQKYEIAFPLPENRKVRKIMFSGKQIAEQYPTISCLPQPHISPEIANGCLLILKTERIIHDFSLDDVEYRGLEVSFPEDFEERYRQYIGSIHTPITEELELLNHSTDSDFVSKQKAQTKALKKVYEEGRRTEIDAMLYGFKQKHERIEMQPKSTPSLYLNSLYLNRVGDLWREPKRKYCYAMGEASNRHKIVRHLAENKEYQKTPVLSDILENKSEQSVRTEIAKIRKNIKKFLKIDGKKVIGYGRKGSGYRINPEYAVRIVKDV